MWTGAKSAIYDCLVCCVSASTSAVSISIIVSVVLGGTFALLLIVLLVVLVFCRRRKHSGSTSHGRRLPTFADVTLNSEITSFLPAAGSSNGGLQSFDFGHPTSSAGEVSRQPTGESDDMPPSYDSVVKSSADIAAVRRRRNGDLTSSSRRSQARLSLPPLTATAIPPVFRTHRRAESDAEEHVYEDPASLRRSISRDGLGSWSVGNYPAVDCCELLPENGGPFSTELDGRGPSELLVDTPPSSDNILAPLNPGSELLQSLPSALTSISSLNVPISYSQARVPRVRLGTSALYCRPESRAADFYRSGELPASANHLRPFSPLSAVGYAEITEGLTHPYQIPGDDFPCVHSPHAGGCAASVGWQPPVSVSQLSRMYNYRPEFEPRSQPQDVHSTPSGNYRSTSGQYFADDLSLTDDQFNNMSSSSAESDHVDMSQVSPLFDDEIVGSIVI